MRTPSAGLHLPDDSSATASHPRAASQSRIHRLTLERQHAEHALVHSPQRFLSDESLEGFDPQRELAQGQRTLAAERAVPQPAQIVFGVVVRAIDDSQILAAAALECRLNQALAPLKDKLERLHHHPLAPL